MWLGLGLLVFGFVVLVLIVDFIYCCRVDSVDLLRLFCWCGGVSVLWLLDLVVYFMSDCLRCYVIWWVVGVVWFSGCLCGCLQDLVFADFCLVVVVDFRLVLRDAFVGWVFGSVFVFLLMGRSVWLVAVVPVL